MSIVQISKIQHRTGNLVDLPQLSDAELGWASDAKRLFIGTTPPENIEVLTSYSSISFSQIDGSANANLNLGNLYPGQTITYDTATNAFINTGGNALDPGNSTYYSNTDIHLGAVANVKIGDGVSGYILQTDGTGNLSWTPQDINVPGNGLPDGSNTQIQFNDDGFFNGSANLTFDTATNLLTAGGNVLIGGNLTVEGNITYINIETLQVQDPIISLGGGANGAPLTVNDGKDRGTELLYYTTTPVTAFMGWDNSNSEFAFGSDVTITNEVVSYNQFGNVRTGGIVVNGNITPSANVTYDLGNNTNRFNDLWLSNSTIYLGDQTISANATAVNVSGNLSANGQLLLDTGTLVADTPAMYVTQTWSNSSVIFTGLYVDITDTNSGSASNIADLRVDGVAQMQLTKTGNLYLAGQLNAQGSLNTPTITSTTLTTGSSATPGTIIGTWALAAGSQLNATYADLAEYYEADQKYPPGTVLEFGGEKEVTIAEDGTSRVAGVVSTDPAYVMNMKCPGEHIVAVALQGRVPCKVRGKISKGDMLVSGGGGYARPTNSPQMGTVIGKSLENFDGIEGVIEVAVGRL